MRYNELKYDGQSISEQWKIDEILLEHKFSWLVNAEIQNARLEIINNTLVWNAGIWYNGSWKFGVFRDGEWKYGTWENGVWYNGKWKGGIFKSGIIFNGVFVKGQFLGGEIRGGKFIDCEIAPTVKEYVPGEKQQEIIDMQQPLIPPVQVRTDLHVVVKENKKTEMNKIKKFELFKEEKDFDYHQTKIAKRTLKMPNEILGVMGGPTKEEAKEFLKKRKEARKSKKGKRPVKESVGDIQPQFTGNGFDKVNISQIGGGIEMSSYSETDIYNLQQTHGGDVVRGANGLYILYIKDKKFESKIVNEEIRIVDDFFNKLANVIDGEYFPNIKFYRDDDNCAAAHYDIELFNNGAITYDSLISKLAKHCNDTRENIEKIVKEFVIFESKKVNETISSEDFEYYKDKEPGMVYSSLDEFERALRRYNGSLNPDEKVWSDLMLIGDKKYLLTEYGGMRVSYMIFTNLDDENDYFTVNYEPVTTNWKDGVKNSKPFQFFSID